MSGTSIEARLASGLFSNFRELCSGRGRRMFNRATRVRRVTRIVRNHADRCTGLMQLPQKFHNSLAVRPQDSRSAFVGEGDWPARPPRHAPPRPFAVDRPKLRRSSASSVGRPRFSSALLGDAGCAL